jgi:hypothetical protein
MVDHIAHDLIPVPIGARAVQIRILEKRGVSDFQLWYGFYNKDNSFFTLGKPVIFSEYNLPLIN